MRLSNMPSSLIALGSIVLSHRVAAALIPDFFQSFDLLHGLEKRCANPCGYYGQLCCSSDEYCYTDANGQAQCGASSGGGTTAAGTWQYITTTYVQTDLQTVTATYSTYVPGATQPPTTMSCAYSQGETPCGSTCCSSGYYCQASNMCVQVPGGSSGYYSSLYTVTTVITNTASAPLRPTTQTVLTLTSTGVSTTAFSTATSTGGAIISGQQSGGGLSGGAIAGIVIGVIAGLLILLLICACCCFKGLIDGILAIFGLGPRRRRRTEETIIEERHSHRSGKGRTWFGTRPGRNTTTEVIEEKKKSTFGRGLGVAAFLGTAAVLLGLKRRRDRRDDDKSSTGYYGSDYYSYDYTSDSEFSRSPIR